MFGFRALEKYQDKLNRDIRRFEMRRLKLLELAEDETVLLMLMKYQRDNGTVKGMKK
jgi:hypothetical protein